MKITKDYLEHEIDGKSANATCESWFSIGRFNALKQDQSHRSIRQEFSIFRKFLEYTALFEDSVDYSTKFIAILAL